MNTEKKLLSSKEDLENEKNLKIMKKKIKFQFYMISLGICLVYSGYSATMALQTSINIEEGEGSKIVAIAYFVAIFVCFVLVPNIVRFLGVKTSMILSEIAIIQYLIGNMVQNKIALQVSAIIASSGDSLFWIPLGLLLVYYSKEYKKYSRCLSEESCFAKMTGILFPVFTLNNVLGNCLVFIVLKVTKIVMELLNTDYITTPITSNTSSYEYNDNISLTTNLNTLYNFSNDEKTYTYCAANDCQNKNTTASSLDQYVPPKEGLYASLCCLILVQLAGVILHIRYIPNILLEHVNEGEKHSSQKIKSIYSIVEPILKTFKLFFFTINQWVLFIPGSYFGFSIGFITAELTRAYASCILGVGSVALMLVVHSLAFGLFSLMWSKLLSKKGRVPSIAIWFVSEVVYLLMCLFYKPSLENNFFFVSVIYFSSGVCTSMNQHIVSMYFSLIFPKHRDISFIFWNITFYFGFSLAFGISTKICVYSKLYIMLIGVNLSAIFMYVLHFRLQKQNGIITNEKGQKTDL